jgi:prepilin-type N-terminal cleavage/methylation domain-containing protein
MRRQRYLPFSHARIAPVGRSPAGRRAGFTLVEMMVAVVILSVGLLGLASTAGYVVRQVGGGAQQGIAANVIQSRVEWMRSIPCASIKESTTVTRGVTEHWVPGATVNKVLAVADTVKYSVMGSQAGADHSGMTTRVYTIMVPCW